MSEPTRDETMFDGCLAVVALLLVVPLLLFEGWAVSRMWEWSVVAAFKWPALPASAAVAAIALWQFLRFRHKEDNRPQAGRRGFDSVMASLIATAVLLGTAYLARLVFA